VNGVTRSRQIAARKSTAVVELMRMDIRSGLATLARRAADCLHAAFRRDDERGQGMVEYALILVLISIVVIVILQVVGQQVNNVFSNVSNGLLVAGP
jgi:pilus assembly protein Flp/PilA